MLGLLPLLKDFWHYSQSKMDINKICLIIPPSIFLLDERVFLTLGILKVAAILEQHKYKIDVLDLSGISNYEEVVEEYIKNNDTIIFGLTATTPQIPQTIKIADRIKTLRPDSKLILGGPHVTLTNAGAKMETKSNRIDRAHWALEELKKKFDTLVCGDGEEAIFEVLNNNFPKMVDADDTKSPLFLNNQKLDELPWPSRHLVDVNSYNYTIDDIKATSAIFQLGCPFTCNFCSGRNSPFLRKIRTRSTQNIINEIEHIYKTYGIKGIMAYDDELNVNPKMIELMDALTAMQNKLGVEFRFRGFIKSELFTDNQAKAMYRAGFRWMLTGFESGSDRILKNINKKATKDENTRCIDIAHKYGIKVKALMSSGHAGESEETLNDTKEWLLKVRPDDFDCTIITPYPGSPYYDASVPHSIKGQYVYTSENNDKLYSYWLDYTKTSDYYKGIPGEYKAYVYTDYLKENELIKLRDDLESDVRYKLNIPFNHSKASQKYEKSMGQSGPLPDFIFKTTNN